MDNSKNMQVFASIVALAEAERQFRDVKGLIDRTLATAQRFWPVIPAVAAGWVFMVSDDQRYDVLQHLADQVLDVIPPLEPLQRLLPS